MTIPNTKRDALLLDKLNGDNKWDDAMTKEMTALEKLKFFRYHPPGTSFDKRKGWQFTKIHIIFDIKQQDLRHKARFVVGRHMLDSSMYNTYLSTIQGISIRLLFLIAMDNNLNIMTGDVNNAFPTAPCSEKVLTVAGPEFGKKKGELSK